MKATGNRFEILATRADGRDLYEAEIADFDPQEHGDDERERDGGTVYHLGDRRPDAIEIKRRLLADHPGADVRIYEIPVQAGVGDRGHDEFTPSEDGQTFVLPDTARPAD